jgi:hypothetical protein
MQITANFGYLHATGGHSGTIYLRQWHANFACTNGQLHAKPPVFGTHENIYLNYKMKMPLKNLRIYATQVLAKAYPLTLCMAQSILVRQFL